MHEGGRSQRGQVRQRSMVQKGIADGVVAKDGDLFVISRPSGDLPLSGEHGFGVYYHDCRFLGGYELTIGGAAPTPLESDQSRGFAASFALTNPRLVLHDHRPLEAHELGVLRERVLVAKELSVYEIISIHSFARHPIIARVMLSFRAEFEDVFVVRGVRPPRGGRHRRTELDRAALSFAYDGEDGITRTLDLHVAPDPESVRDAIAAWNVHLHPRETRHLLVVMRVGESLPGERPRIAEPVPEHAAVAAEIGRSVDVWLGGMTRVESSSRLLDAVHHRSLLDLRLLRSSRHGRKFYAAGVPWYVTLFGRDSLLVALQTLAFDPDVAAETLRLLAAYQGTAIDPERDEEPGKILHEHRIGELSNAGEMPFNPYYGTVDATPLFLVLLARHAAWTGRLDLFCELEQNAARAVAWIEHTMAESPGGWVSYASRSARGLRNQGWKDSDDAIVLEDGSCAEPPIALCEVQGYAYLALRGVARLHDRTGNAAESRRCEALADRLRARFNERFWREDKGIFALALSGDDERPAAVVSSNAGQALWSGIADADKAHRTVERLMRADVFAGWGIRTLSVNERRYNPMGYHLGTIWPHDSAFVAAGLRRYGHDREACRVFGGLLDLAAHLPYLRLPELISGFGRDEFSRPVPYPVACHPQAWAAGAVPFLLETLLGLVPDGLARRLRVVRPALPEPVSRLDLKGLNVAGELVDLRFERASGAVAVAVLRATGDLRVDVEPEGEL